MCSMNQLTPAELQEIENNHLDHQAFLQAIQTNNVVQFFDKGVEYDMAQLRQDPDIVKTWTRTHRAYVYARLNQRRPNGPATVEFNRIDIFCTYKGDISVNSYLIDEIIERKNALHEAVARKNLPYLKWLLEEKHADPNQPSFVGGLIFDHVIMECSPIEQTLRGFLVWDDKDSLLVGRMMDLLLNNGSTQQDQRRSLIRILRDNVSLHMVCMELLHFMHMTSRLLDRDQSVLTEDMSHEFNSGFPLMLRSCEKKWFEEAVEMSAVVQYMDRVLAEVPVFLSRVTPPEHFSLQPDTFRTLTIHRCYRTLATLFKTYGCRAVSVAPLSLMIAVPPANIEPIFSDAHRSRCFLLEQVIANHTRRVGALIIIMARLFPVTHAVRDFLLQYYRVLIGDENVILPQSVYKLQNRCVSVLKQEVLAKRLTENYIASRLLPTPFSDIFQSNVEYLTLAIFDPLA
ncbi:hypothetical protein RvY_04085 [Ramazzottius varieornatus]|uniref:Uncharacterized protein n=1 Tax=Ramazzottius varieornatus TaxID=947166 RepID=A0A1D1UQE1_RAMVA|nr:hypothetical protein RvY_04085 [Ramazzottius varieornatus]